MDLIVTHVNADFDAVASAMAAQKLYPNAKILLPSNLEKRVRDFIDVYKPFEIIKFKDVINVQRLIVVDAQAADRIEHFQEIVAVNSPKIIIYDHHPEGIDKLKSAFEIIQPLGAASSLFVEVLQKEMIQITPLEATLLSLGIYEETGSFLYSSTTARDLAAASYLLKRGANLKIVSSFLTSELTKDEFSLMNELIHNTKELTLYDVTIRIAKASLENYGDVAHLARRLMKIQDIDCIFLLLATADKTLIIARSDATSLNVADVLKTFGGGGHAAAAAATVKNKTFDEIEPELISTLKKHIKPSKTARDIMTSPVINVLVSDTVKHALTVMTRYGINVVAVLKGKSFYGIISREVASKALFHGFAKARCEEFATTDIVTASSDLPIADVEALMMEHNQRFLPVVDDERLIGAITRTDILRFMYESLLKKGRIASKEQNYGAGIERNIAPLIKSSLPVHVYEMLIKAGELADEVGINIYLVGGCVRDIIRGEENLDIDLVVEHDAIEFAHKFAQPFNATVSAHSRFGTAHISIANFHSHRFDIDIATARTEYYETPGALPKVQASSIKKDLYRRDFTINALAVQINAKAFGRLIDYFGGQRDIKERFIRVLHNLSFVEDPTRAFRAVRFAERFGYRITKHTENLIKHAVKANIFCKVAGVRIFDELRLIFTEIEPLSSLKGLCDRGLLDVIHPDLSLDTAKIALLKSVQDTITWFELSFANEKIDKTLIYMSALMHNSNKAEIFVKLDIPSNMASIIEQTLMVSVNMPQDVISRYNLLKAMPVESAIYAMAQSLPSEKKFFTDYFFTYRFVKPQITGSDLKAIGIKPGPIYKQIFKAIINLKILGKLKTKQDEIEFARGFNVDR